MSGDPRPVPRTTLARGPRRTGAALLAVVLLGALGACGGDADEAADPAAAGTPSPSAPSSSAAEVPAGTPDCADVWSEGVTIPRSYQGCVQDGALVEDDSLACSSGQRLITFDDRYYGVAGGDVRVSEQSLADDADYGSSVRSCRA
ncbi:hypothetical protein [Nocardioides sp. AX2bis]|uniref:hypothetical protein n=1 Tax=Nocardioides sp. AX2bis TaxID=2653157 RepID=UPI0012F431B9|nr:hypothetical protein [Nocardioides sp. AX2bis]VXB12483.1 conserved exported hypothetical protein [Nocardioides sp. AX2bis]